MLIGATNERLCREVKNKIRLHAEKGFFHGVGIAHITDFVLNFLGEAKLFKNGWHGGRRQSETVDTRAQFQKPLRQPRALETGVAGKPDSLALISVVKHHQIFQGASPAAHTSLRYCIS